MVDKLVSDGILDQEISNNHHFGHILLDQLRKHRPDHICQIDAATGEQETYNSVLTRAVKLARSFRKYGLKPGDVMTLAGKNHIDLRIPYFAGLFNGITVAGVDPQFKYVEVKTMLDVAKPKIAFCDYDSYELYKQVAEDLNLDVKIVTFKEGECTLEKYVETYDDGTLITEFEAANFDTEKVFAWLSCTSGTTNNFKLVATKHTALNESIKFGINRGLFGGICENGQKVGLILAPPHWLGAYLVPLGQALRNTVTLQSSKSDSIEHYIDAINKYKPAVGLIGPSALTLFLKNKKYADFTCFDTIIVGGAKLYKEIKIQIQSRIREDAEVILTYGQTETVGPCISTIPSTPISSCGSPNPGRLIKLVHPDTGEEIKQPYKSGELIYKGPRFTEYYNNPEETAKAFTADGWLRTGDILYRDENNNYYFVERLKMLIKWRVHHVMPTEIEDVIVKHPSVLEVCVTSLEHTVDGEWPVACVVRRPGSTVTAQEIETLVADNFAEYKQLRGGVIFMEELPKTSSGKIARMTLREIVRNMKKP